MDSLTSLLHLYDLERPKYLHHQLPNFLHPIFVDSPYAAGWRFLGVFSILLCIGFIFNLVLFLNHKPRPKWGWFLRRESKNTLYILLFTIALLIVDIVLFLILKLYGPLVFRNVVLVIVFLMGAPGLYSISRDLVAYLNRYLRARKQARATPPIKTEQHVTVVAKAPEHNPGPDIERYSPKDGEVNLKIRRSQRSTALGRSIFIINARVELSRDDYSSIQKLGLGSAIVYESDNRRKHAENAAGHAEATRGASTGRAWFQIARATFSAAAAALSLRVTIDSLLSGVQIECKDLDELLEAEGAIVDACKTMKSYLEIAATFDGREILVGI